VSKALSDGLHANRLRYQTAEGRPSSRRAAPGASFGASVCGSVADTLAFARLEKRSVDPRQRIPCLGSRLS
jgi:hypothetical protein